MADGFGPNPFAEEDDSGETKQWFTCWEELKATLPPDAIRSATVMPPTQIKWGMVKKRWAYQVRPGNAKYTTRRFFADFEWLCDTLVEKYLGMWIPAMPAKNPESSIRAGKDIYVENRPVQLHHWLNSILSNPFLCQDSAIIAFLTVQDDKEFEELKKEKNTLFSESSQGAGAWWGIVRNLDSNPEAPQMIEAAKIHLSALLLAAKGQRDRTLTLCVTSRQLVLDARDGLDNHDSWAHAEMHPESDEKVPSPSACGTTAISESLKAITSTVGVLNTSIIVLNRVHTTMTLPSVMHHISMIEGALTMIKMWEEGAVAIDKKDKEIEKLVDKRDGMVDMQEGRKPARRGSVWAAFDNQTTTTDKVEKSIAAREEEVKELRRLQTLRERAIFFSEIERFFVERAQRAASLSMQICAASEATCTKITTGTADLKATFKLQTEHFAGKVDAIFDESAIQVTVNPVVSGEEA